MTFNRKAAEYHITRENIDVICKLNGCAAIKYVRKGKKKATQKTHLGAKQYRTIAELH